METRVVLALAVGFVLGLSADGRAETVPPASNADGGASLVELPNSSAGAPTNSQTEAPWPPPPRSLDSKRAPVPDRLMLPEDMLDIPLAPPTPPIPNNSGSNGQTGSGANRTSKIFKNASKTSPEAPSEIPRDNVTRIPEDQLAPPAYPAQGPR
ncbi:MAG TPA: hypothetical protein VLC06_15320 [Polyangia bacterium]|jgi:hypothetical protein|nr:hypothetical protein [Polyangia bacterium]